MTDWFFLAPCDKVNKSLVQPFFFHLCSAFMKHKGDIEALTQSFICFTSSGSSIEKSIKGLMVTGCS